MVQRFSLKNDDIVEAFFEETRLLGIVTAVKDYRFCWKLNKLLNLDFRINSEIEIQLKRKNRQYYFSVYEYCESNGFLCHYLYNNQFDGEYLLPEFKHLDFLWLMKNEEVSDEYVKQLVLLIRELPDVQLVTELTQEKIKNKERLLF